MTGRREATPPSDDARLENEPAEAERVDLDARAVLEHMNLPVMVWDRVRTPPGPGWDAVTGAAPKSGPTRFVLRWANAEFERTSGREVAWACGRAACEICPDGEIPFREVLEEVLATGEAARFERWCDEHQQTCQGHVFRTGEGQVSLVMVDVSSHTAALEQAARATRRVQARLDALPVLVYELDAQGNAVYWNHATARALELPEEPHEPRALDQVLDPESRELARAAVAEILERDETVPELVYDLRSYGGKRVTIQATGRRLLHEDGPPTALIVARDITREREAHEAHEALARTWTPTARSRLRHDLNNVLGRIMAAASLVEMEETLTPDGLKHLEMVLTACEEAADIIARDRREEKGPRSG